jgi:hypothetical protein
LTDQGQGFREELRKLLLTLPDVTLGRRFGGEAFFFRKKFFCHFHPAKNIVFLETFVWNRVSEVTKEVPGVIPHPEYGGSGWVRLPLNSEDDVQKGERLIENTYRYLRTIRRISLRKDKIKPGLIDAARNSLPQVRFKVKEAKKIVQIMIETVEVADFEQADRMLGRAASMLKRSRSDLPSQENR